MNEKKKPKDSSHEQIQVLGWGGGIDREASIIGPNPFKILADLGAMALCPLPLGLLLIYTYLLILGDLTSILVIMIDFLNVDARI